MAEQQSDAVKDILGSLVSSRVAQQLLTMLGLAASVAIAVAIVLWTREPTFKTLYSGIEPERAVAVVEALDGAGIEHRFQDSSGSIMVPAAQLHEARMKMAGAGLNRSSGGMAMLDEQQGFGLSEFMQSRKYHHALESELASTIESLHQVRHARIHLAIPKQSVFVRERKQPSASVMLDLVPGSTLRAEHVGSIVNLVAASISGLDAAEVTVVDQRGSLLSESDKSGGADISNRQIEYREQLEKGYEERISSLLAPITGRNRLRVKVAADIDFTSFQESRESWTPEKRVIRSEQINREGKGSGLAGGVPGALSNKPVGAGEDDGDGGRGGIESVTRNYEIERILNHVDRPGGEIRRLSVAVVIDNLKTLSEEGVEEIIAVSPQELSKYQQLVSDAIGLSSQRGDSITVVSADFLTDNSVLEERPETGFWQQAWFGELLRQGLSGFAVILLVMVVLRPGMRSLMNSGAPALAATPALAGGQPALSGAAVAVGSQSVPALASADLNKQMDSLRLSAGEDPARVAQVVKKWVNSDDA